MTITYPRELHSYRLSVSTFTLMEAVSVSRAKSGRAISAVEWADPHFEIDITTVQLSYDERKAWSAWKNSLRGGMKSFLAYDVSRKYPAAYPNGVPQIEAGTWNGEASAPFCEARLIRPRNVPVGFILSDGDHVGLVQNGQYGLFEVTETAVATGAAEWVSGAQYTYDQVVSRSGSYYRCIQPHTAAAGNAPGSGASWMSYWAASASTATTMSIPVEPHIPLNVFSNPTAVLYRPKGEFILLSDTWEAPTDTNFAPISFRAVQKI